MTQNSIILENVSTEELKGMLSEAVKNAIAYVQPKENKFVSRQEAATKFGISLPTLDKSLKNGILKGYRIGGRILLKEAELSLSEIPIRKHR